MKNVLEKTLAAGLFAFGIGIVQADIGARQDASLAGSKAAEREVSTARFLDEPRQSTELVLVRHKGGAAHKVDFSGGVVVGGTNLAARSDSMQTSRYVGADRALRPSSTPVRN